MNSVKQEGRVVFQNNLSVIGQLLPLLSMSIYNIENGIGDEDDYNMANLFWGSGIYASNVKIEGGLLKAKLRMRRGSYDKLLGEFPFLPILPIPGNEKNTINEISLFKEIYKYVLQTKVTTDFNGDFVNFRNVKPTGKWKSFDYHININA